MKRSFLNRLGLLAATALLGAWAPEAQAQCTPPATVQAGVVRDGNDLVVRIKPSATVPGTEYIAGMTLTVKYTDDANVSLGTPTWASDGIGQAWDGFFATTTFLGQANTVSNGGFKYTTYVTENTSLGLANLAIAGVTLTANTELDLLRIPLTISNNACAVFSLENDAYTGSNNLDWYIAFSGCDAQNGFFGTQVAPVVNENSGLGYCTIQSAIDAAQTVDGHTIRVEAGTYREFVTLSKSLELKGPNWNTPGYSNSRVAEAIIRFPTGQTTPGEMSLMDIGLPNSTGNPADGSIVRGFTFDGSDYTVDWTTSGVYALQNDLVITNNIVKNFNKQGIVVTSWRYINNAWDNTYWNNGAQIADNLIVNDEDLRPSLNNASFGFGIYLQGTYASVERNIVQGYFRTGIQVQPYNNPNTGNTVGLVSSNTFVGYARGMYFNYSENANGNWSFVNNEVTGIAIPNVGMSNTFSAVHVNTFIGGTCSIQNNSITLGAANGTTNVLFLEQGTTAGVLGATCNWFGSTDASVVEAGLSGNVTFLPFLVSGTDSDLASIGFQPEAGTCTGQYPVRVYSDLAETTYVSGHMTISAAISAATTLAGHVVRVDAGTYTENVSVNKRLNIRGAGSGSDPASNTIITAAAAGTATMVYSVGGADATDRQVLEDVRVTGATGGTGNNNSGILFSGASMGYFTFDNIVSTGNTGHGLVSNVAPATSTLTDVVITGSSFSGNGAAGISTRSHNVDGFTMTDCTIHNNTTNGITFNPSDNATVVIGGLAFTNVTFSGNGGVADLYAHRMLGNMSLTNVDFLGSNGTGLFGYYMLGGYVNQASAPAIGTVTLNDVTVSGTYTSAGISFLGYSDLAGVSMTDVVLSTSIPTANRGHIRLSGVAGTLDLGNTAFVTPASVPPALDILLNSNFGASGSIATVQVDATNATFDGVLGSAMTLSQLFTIEDRIRHAIDGATDATGFVRVKAGEVFVTANSFASPTTTTPSINRGVSAATAGDTLHVQAATYTETVTVNKQLDIRGAGATTIITNPGGTAITYTAAGSGATSVMRAYLRDVKVSGSTKGLYAQELVNNLTLTGVTVDGNSSYGFHVNNTSGTMQDWVFTNCTFNANSSAIYVSTAANLNGLEMTGCSFTNQTNSAFYAGQSSSTPGGLSNVTITGCSFTSNGPSNNQAAMYIEKLSNATISGNTYTNNGLATNPRGIIVNLKYGSYSDVTISDNTITDTRGAVITSGYGINVQGRNDAPSYSANPGSLADLDIAGNTISGFLNGIEVDCNVNWNNTTVTNNVILNSTYGILGVIYGTGNTANTGTVMEVHDNSITGATLAVVSVNPNGGSIDASCNWYGTSDPATVQTLISGSVSAVPYLVGGTDDGDATNGFQPQDACNGVGSVTSSDPVSSYFTVGAAIAGSNSGATITVAAGTYNESIIVDKPVSLLGANAGTALTACGQVRSAETVINGSTGAAITIASNGVTVDGFELQGAIGLTSTGYTDLVVTNNQVNTGAQGISVAGATTSATDEVTITGNAVTLSTQAISTTPTTGIVLASVGGDAAATVSNNILCGGFYGYALSNVTTTPRTVISGGSITGVMQGVAAFNSLLVAPFTPLPMTAGVDGITMSGFTGDVTAIPSANFHAGVYVFTGGADNSAVVDLTVNNVDISGTGKHSPASGGLYFADFSTAANALQNVSVTNSHIHGNLNRGVIARGANASVSVSASDIADNGADPHGVGGNDGYGVIANEGAQLSLSNCNIVNPAAQVAYTVFAIGTGPGSGQSITVQNSNIDGNGNGTVINVANGSVTATCNWWGTADVDALDALIPLQAITFLPYLNNGTDDDAVARGFQTSAACVNPTKWYVNDNATTGDVYTLAVGNDANVGTIRRPKLTMNAAIGVAAAGDTLFVDAGSYSEPVDVSKGLDIRGANYGVDPNTGSRGAETVNSFNGDYAVEIFASDVRFDGFSVNNATGNAVRIAVGRQNPGSTANVANVTVSNNIATGDSIKSWPGGDDNSWLGVMSFDNFEDAQYTASNIAFENNRLTVSDVWGRGITMAAYNGATLTGAITISGNHILTSGSPTNVAGIELRNGTGFSSMQGVSISGNTFDGFDMGAVWPRWWPTTPTISGNTFVNNVHDIRLSSSGNVVGVNTFSGSTSAIWNETSENVDISTTASGSTFGGITLDASTSLADLFAIEDKIIHKVDIGALGFVRVKAGEVYVTPNSFFSSTTTPDIQRGVDAATAADILHVGAGTYAESVTVNKALDIRGANYGVACGSRGAESVIAPATGLPVNVTADGVSLNGFEITAPSYQYAILCGNRSDLSIVYNNIHDINSSGTPALTPTHAIQYTVANAPAATSNVSVTDNCISNVGSAALTGNSATAMGFLQSTTTGTLSNLTIARNTISNVTVNSSAWPTGKIAYGIQLNAGGGSGYLTSTGKIVNAVIEDNEITGLSGHIATGIGLEGNTENAVVTGNKVSNLTSTKNAVQSGGGVDLNGLKFENNRFVSTVTVEDNSFDVTTFNSALGAGVGYAVANYVPVANGGVADVSCNWFGSSEPSDLVFNAGLTAAIFTKENCQVSFVPWLLDGSDVSANIGFQPGAACAGYPVTLTARAVLSGPYVTATGLMRDDLRSLVTFPTTEPYTALGYTDVVVSGPIASGVLDVTGNDAIVDWVLVEVRDAATPATVLHRRAALMQRDGDIVDTDGSTPIYVWTLARANYHVAVRHRNHLGAMTASSQFLGNAPSLIDFRSIATFGTEAQRQLVPGVSGLWEGNTRNNTRIAYTGANNDRDPILLALPAPSPTSVRLDVYNQSDVNLDGDVKYTGANNDRAPILSNIGGNVPTAVRLQQLP